MPRYICRYEIDVFDAEDAVAAARAAYAMMVDPESMLPIFVVQAADADTGQLLGSAVSVDLDKEGL